MGCTNNKPDSKNGQATKTDNNSGPTTSDIKLVEDSWTAVKNSGATFDKVGMDIFLTLFDNNPGFKPVFKFTDANETAAELRENERLQKHATGVVKHVDTAVTMLSAGQTDELISILKKLGHRHRGYGAKKEHFEAVGVAILTTLQQGLGDGFTTEVKQAWVKVYGVIANVMGGEME